MFSIFFKQEMLTPILEMTLTFDLQCNVGILLPGPLNRSCTTLDCFFDAQTKTVTMGMDEY